MTRMGKIGVYGTKTRTLQRRISYEAFGLSHKEANFYLYLGDKNSDVPDIDKFECKIFYEVPDRLYSQTPIGIPIGLDPHNDSKMDFSRFGLINPMTDETLFRVHIDDFTTLGREIVIGDVFEMPFFIKNEKKAFWEVTDVDLKTEYEKFIAIIHATPLEASRSTRDIPYNRDNEDFINSVMVDADTLQSGIITSNDISYDHSQMPTPSDVDYRDDLQSDFLDDPTKEF